MQFTITFSMDSDAFADNRSGEAARILRSAADRITYSALEPFNSGPVKDLNGNTVGTWEVTGE